MRIATDPVAPRIAASVIIRLRRELLDNIGERRANTTIDAVNGRKVTLAEQESHAILDDGSTEGVANTRATVAQWNILAAGASLLVELVRQNIVQLAVKHAFQNVQRARPR